jgi:hypothetical protein
MLLIGIGYKARQGKNFVANYWKEAHPEIKFYAFADALKEYCRDNHEALAARYYREHQLHPMRHPLQWKEDPVYGCVTILQWYGCKKRETDPNYWVEVISQKIRDEQPEIAVVTDVRFPNEADWIKLSGGYLVEVIRKNQDGTRYLASDRDPNHVSETALDDFNFDYTIIAKSGDLAALKSKAIGVLDNILIEYESLYLEKYKTTITLSPDILSDNSPISQSTSCPLNCSDSNTTEVEYVSDIAFDDIFTSNAE